MLVYRMVFLAGIGFIIYGALQPAYYALGVVLSAVEAAQE